MFNKITTASIGALSAAFVGAFFLHIAPQSENAVGQEYFIDKIATIRSKKALEQHPAYQARQFVQKDVWTTNSKKRSHVRLKSEGSDLLITQQNGKIAIQENLKQIECCMQENVDLEKNQQDIRWIVAQEGSYLYPQHQFQAKDAEVILCTVHSATLPLTLPKEPFFTKIAAKTVYFTVKDLLKLRGNVRLVANRAQEKKLFALADELTYDPNSKNFFLLGNNEKRVLFWQDDMKISAAKLQIRKDPSRKEELVKGFGDVHFSFDLEEEQTFYELFGKWL